jgi:hypothetical protein
MEEYNIVLSSPSNCSVTGRYLRSLALSSWVVDQPVLSSFPPSPASQDKSNPDSSQRVFVPEKAI